MISIDTTKLRCYTTNTAEVKEGIFVHFHGCTRHYSYQCHVSVMYVLQDVSNYTPFRRRVSKVKTKTRCVMISFSSSCTAPPIMDPDIDAKSSVTVCKTLSPPAAAVGTCTASRLAAKHVTFRRQVTLTNVKKKLEY